MINQTRYLSTDIKLSCIEEKTFRAEVQLEHHSLVWIISGETKIVLADSTYIFKAGDIFLFPRNQLATNINYAKNGLPHKAIAMHFTIKRLQDFYAKNKPAPGQVYPHKIRIFEKHPLLENCLASMLPYFDLKVPVPENLITIKIEEAVNILRLIDKNIDGLLANFDKPGKIDLAGFMEQNYMFNMTMDKFSYLSGRSLTTFKRDFKNLYHTTPQKWLTQKRLELAHYQLSEKKRKPSEVYVEAGFENLSHFTYIFKKHFGYTPTELTAQKKSGL